jgi:hypothetical protein
VTHEFDGILCFIEISYKALGKMAIKNILCNDAFFKRCDEPWGEAGQLANFLPKLCNLDNAVEWKLRFCEDAVWKDIVEEDKCFDDVGTGEHFLRLQTPSQAGDQFPGMYRRRVAHLL